MWRILVPCLSAAATCGGGSTPPDNVAGAPWGACSSTPNAEGGYSCVEMYGDAAGKPGWVTQCADGNGVMSDTCPGGANPGCCVQGPTADGTMQINCTYKCLDEICQGLASVCTNAGGTWR